MSASYLSLIFCHGGKIYTFSGVEPKREIIEVYQILPTESQSKKKGHRKKIASGFFKLPRPGY